MFPSTASSSVYRCGGGITMSGYVIIESALGGSLGCVAALLGASISKNFFGWIDLEKVADANPGRISYDMGIVNFSGPVLIAESSTHLHVARAVICVATAVLGYFLTGAVAKKGAGEDAPKLDAKKQRILKVSVAILAGGAALYLTRNMPTKPGIYFW